VSLEAAAGDASAGIFLVLFLCRLPRLGLSRAAGVAPHIGRPKWKPVPSSYPIGASFPASDLRCLRMLNSATSSASPMSKIWPYIAIATTI